MTFEYRDERRQILRSTAVEPDLPEQPVPPAIWITTSDGGWHGTSVYIPLDRVEEVIAGIRDAARTAAARQTPPTGSCGCGAPATPDVVHRQGAPCYMDQDGGLQTVELPTTAARQTTGQDDTTPPPAVNPACTNCNGTAVGQPAEAQAAVETLLTAAERKFLHFALDEAAEEMSYGDGFTDEDQAALDRLRLLAGKDER